MSYIMSLAGLGDESQEVRKLLEFSKDAVTFSRDASVDPLSLCVSSVLQKGRAPCFHQIEGVRTSSRGLCQWIQSLLIFIFIMTIYYFIYVFFPSGLQVKASPPGGSGFHQLRGQIRPHVRSLQNNQAVTQSQNQ